MTIKKPFQNLLSEFRVGASNWDSFITGATEALAETLGCSRTSIWRFSRSRHQLMCEDQFLADTGLHRKGDLLSRTMYPDFLWNLEESQLIVASEARTDPHTSFFNESYFLPRDIHSLLAATIFVDRRVEGVVCCEHTGSVHAWRPAHIAAVRMAAAAVETAMARPRPIMMGAQVRMAPVPQWGFSARTP